MNIKLTDIGKRFHYEWIFKELNYSFEIGNYYGVVGSNGSGKSTLLQILSGYLSPSQGKVEFSLSDNVISNDYAYKCLSFAAPYIELIEEFTLKESIDFHWNFKKMKCSQEELYNRLEFPKNAYNKAIKFFSSGMQQRLKLALAICSDTSCLLLDEPTITLDKLALNWYHDLLNVFAYKPNRLTIIASNIEEDYFGCNELLNIGDYKTARIK
ncbi:MAG: ATP-binding cassette domain-containing protein [Saprospiraceae bacterium]|nr:ATP-binding cassette domain-containing protein [Saprospiraceae bacterium]